MPYRNDGISCARAIKPHEVIPGDNNESYAKKTALGWGIIGIVDRGRDILDDDDGSINVNRTVTCEDRPESKGTCHFVLKSSQGSV